jgi:hypothetical protein
MSDPALERVMDQGFVALQAEAAEADVGDLDIGLAEPNPTADAGGAVDRSACGRAHT